MTASRTLGFSGIAVPAVGIGCNAFGARIDADRVVQIVDAAIDEGATFFDTADVYGQGASEELLGRAIRGRRDQVIIATKFGMDMEGANGDDGGRRGTASYVKTAVEASLRRLAIDHIDLYQFHTPDPTTPIEETLQALDELVQAGTVRAIGCSNMQAWQMVDAHWQSSTRGLAAFATAQNEYSLYNRMAEIELVPASSALGVGILPYFPLAYGLLTGKYRRDEAAPSGTRLEIQSARLQNADWARIDELQDFADRHSISLLEVAIGGLAAQPAVSSVIAGVTSADQVRANAQAGRWTPTDEQRAELSGIGRPSMSYTTFAP